MARVLRNIAALKLKGTGSIASGGIYSAGIMNDGTWAGGGFRITNTSGANTGDQGIPAALVTGTAQGFVLSDNALYCLARSNNVGFQTGILKKAAAIGNFGASMSNLHTALGLGQNMYMSAAAWMPDNQHFWISGPTTNNLNSGQNLMWLCRYDPATNTVVLVDTYNAGGEITQMLLSPDKTKLLCLDGSVTSNGFFVLNLRAGYKVASRVNTTASTSSPNVAFWHPRLNMFGYTNFNSSGSMVVLRWNGSSYASISTPVPGALTRGGGFLFSGFVLWCIQGTTLRLYDVSTDGLTITNNVTITPPTVIATSTVNPKFRTTDDNATLGMFTTANGAYILASNDLAMRANLSFPNMTFAGSVGVEAAGELHPVFPTLKAEISARRNEYYALDAQFPKMASAVEAVTLYASVDAILPKPVYATTVMVLDEPYEPFATTYKLSVAPVALTTESGDVYSDDAGQFAYTLGWDFPLMQADLSGSQDVNASAEFLMPQMLADIRMGELPVFSGDFVSPKAIFAASGFLFPVGNLSAEFPLTLFDAEGVLPSDVAILDALLPTASAEFEVFNPPGGFVEAEFPVLAFEGEGIVPYGIFVEAEFPALAFESDVNVPLGVLLDAELPTLDAAIAVMVPNYAEFNAEFPSLSFDSGVSVPYVMELDAVAPLMQTDVDVIFKYQAELGVTFPSLEFSGEPPVPVDAEIDAQFYKLEAEAFGGPVTTGDLDIVAPAVVFDGRMIMGPRIDANFRMPKKLEAAITAKFVLTGVLDAVFPLLQADLFGGNIVKGDLDAQFPNVIYKGIVRVGNQPTGDGSPFQLSYHKMSKRQKIFTPIRMPPS